MPVSLTNSKDMITNSILIIDANWQNYMKQDFVICAIPKAWSSLINYYKM